MQNTVESATFGDEMAAMRLARDQTVALRLKLEMFGVPDDAQSTFVVIGEHEHPYLSPCQETRLCELLPCC